MNRMVFAMQRKGRYWMPDRGVPLHDVLAALSTRFHVDFRCTCSLRQSSFPCTIPPRFSLIQVAILFSFMNIPFGKMASTPVAFKLQAFSMANDCSLRGHFTSKYCLEIVLFNTGERTTRSLALAACMAARAVVIELGRVFRRWCIWSLWSLGSRSFVIADEGLRIVAEMLELRDSKMFVKQSILFSPYAGDDLWFAIDC